MNIWMENKREDMDLDPEVQEDIMILENSERNGKEVVEDNNQDKGNVHSLSESYT